MEEDEINVPPVKFRDTYCDFEKAEIRESLHRLDKAFGANRVKEITLEWYSMPDKIYNSGPIPCWIKWNQRLPEPYEQVLGWSFDTGIMIVFFNEKSQKWVLQPTLEEWNVTYWMPLPPPPEEK